jgi:putative glutamine amidotransferase
MKKPIIGLTLDYDNSATGYSKMPWYAIRENYCQSIADAGGVPIALPHDPQHVDYYHEILDGLVITGGNFDIPPSMYGESDVHEKVSTIESRSNFEFAMTKKMIDGKKPILGICGGQQLLNVVLGGSLIQHVPDEFGDEIAHEQPNPRTEAGHFIKPVSGTLLAKIIGENDIPVNSAHHQAVRKPAPDVVINAYAPDGVIEGIEYTNHPFCLGIQWHPEYYISAADKKIFDAFIRHCL